MVLTRARRKRARSGRARGSREKALNLSVATHAAKALAAAGFANVLARASVTPHHARGESQDGRGVNHTYVGVVPAATPEPDGPRPEGPGIRRPTTRRWGRLGGGVEAASPVSSTRESLSRRSRNTPAFRGSPDRDAGTKYRKAASRRRLLRHHPAHAGNAGDARRARLHLRTLPRKRCTHDPTCSRWRVRPSHAASCASSRRRTPAASSSSHTLERRRPAAAAARQLRRPAARVSPAKGSVTWNDTPRVWFEMRRRRRDAA